MMEEEDSRRKRSKRNNNNNSTDSIVPADRISALPDHILGEILSFLLTKQAVATSILSKRWKSAWENVHSLDFDSIYTQDMVFIRFVHRVFNLIGAKPLNKFNLDLEYPIGSIILSHVICWIDDAITRKVRELTLYLGYGELLKLPICLFNCDSLRSLTLLNIVFVYDTTVGCLPRLETLKLYTVRFTSEEAFEKLINGCPMLHSLDIQVTDMRGLKDYIVFSPSLRRLYMLIDDVSINGACTLKLNAPSLEYLSLEGFISGIFEEKSLSALVEAKLDFELDEDDLPHNLIVEATRVIEHAKFLTTSCHVLRAVGLATKFKRLVKLKIDHCWGLQDFLHNSENLQELEISQDDDECWRQSTVESCDDSRWTAPVVVPICLSKSLKKVRLDGDKGLEEEREMIHYMLEHGTALEVMEIHCKDKVDGEKLVKEICELPRKSPTCKVTYST